MNHIIGSAVEIFAEIPSDKITGTTLTLESLIDPDGTELAGSESLVFSTVAGKENLASVVWQSVSGSNPTGKYTFIIKSANGACENFAKGNFYLVERTA